MGNVIQKVASLWWARRVATRWSKRASARRVADRWLDSKEQ
jgi:hypothetical protein